MVRARWGNDVVSLIRKLLEGYHKYFDDDELNSDGRRLFEEAARMMIYEHPWVKPLVSKVRRRPSIENVLRLAEEVLGCEAYRILADTLIGPYNHKVTGRSYMPWLREPVGCDDRALRVERGDRRSHY